MTFLDRCHHKLRALADFFDRLSKAFESGREYPVGFGPLTIGPGERATLKSVPEVPFRGRRLIIPSEIASMFVIRGIKIGMLNQLATSNALPGRMFTEFAKGVDLSCDKTILGQSIELDVENVFGSSATFTACLSGKSSSP